MRKDACPWGLFFREGGISAAGTSMRAFAFSLAHTVGRLVIDETELLGIFDFDVKFSPVTLTQPAFDRLDGTGAAASDAPSFYSAGPGTTRPASLAGA